MARFSSTKYHKEGRAAFKNGKRLVDCPYHDSAPRDSDEWLRAKNWQNGWRFAWLTDKGKVHKTRLSR